MENKISSITQTVGGDGSPVWFIAFEGKKLKLIEHTQPTEKEGDMIDVVLDNLNTHHYHSLVEFFGKTEADRIMARLEFHFTPAHASWLNMAEIEISVMSQQCLNQRLPDEWTLAQQLLTWEQISNTIERKINWSFTVDDAKQVFAEYYSVFLS